MPLGLRRVFVRVMRSEFAVGLLEFFFGLGGGLGGIVAALARGLFFAQRRACAVFRWVIAVFVRFELSELPLGFLSFLFEWWQGKHVKYFDELKRLIWFMIA